MIIDYSRRTDIACPEGVSILNSKLKKYGYPALIHFWTKAPAAVADLFSETVYRMKKNNVIVCMQVTLNNYGKPLENVSEDMQQLDKVVRQFGPDHIHLRFDPIIIGYTKMAHFKTTLRTALKYNIGRITVNFIETKYKGVGKALKNYGIYFENGTTEKKIKILNRLRNVTPDNIELAVCAESAGLSKHVEGIRNASCADPEWFKELGLDVNNIKGHSSRKGCGCYYTADWGTYPTRNGYICPHKCIYCYAKHYLYSGK
ncbi:MAG: DUF1848 domain-containing protein [Victivallales bacterium]|nr:DUF1848 domain-containing protein [Victivallales bacterium]